MSDLGWDIVIKKADFFCVGGMRGCQTEANISQQINITCFPVRRITIQFNATFSRSENTHEYWPPYYYVITVHYLIPLSSDVTNYAMLL